jgi:RNA polymerase sigma factor (TIGR02999 family)
MSDGDLTQLLQAAASGDRADMDRLAAAMYDDLRRLAQHHLSAERANHTLQATALANEAYLKLVGQRSLAFADRAHFFAVAARIIRRILVDHARAKLADKRGGGRGCAISVEHEDLPAPARDVDLLALDEAMGQLAEIDERQARIVEMRYFGGLTLEEVAAALSLGRRTVDREWQTAKAWLRLRLSDRADG